MSAAKHTPGPWAFGEMGGAEWVDIFRMEVDEDGCAVRSLPFAACKHFDQEANARLIAAAPEMLEHLLAIAGYADAPHVAPKKALAYIRETALAAIAKATGGHQ